MKNLLFLIPIILCCFNVQAACPNISGQYDLESMAKFCKVKTGGALEIEIDYMIGDDAPLYTVLPDTINKVTIGYIEPGLDLFAGSSSDCQTFSLSFPEKILNGYIYRKLIFKNKSSSSSEVSAQSQEILEENDKTRYLELRKLVLKKEKDNLYFNLKVEYVAQFKKTSKNKLLRFEDYLCEFTKK
jgi:hypothetical protein